MLLPLRDYVLLLHSSGLEKRASEEAGNLKKEKDRVEVYERDISRCVESQESTDSSLVELGRETCLFSRLGKQSISGSDVDEPGASHA